MERKGEMTKALLGQKFKELVVKKSFDKITIKMITDEAGVIRPTFYNYFRDKYEVMEWLLWEDVFSSATELVKMNMARSALEMIFKKIAVDKEYYARVFEVKGQNSFEDMLYHNICNRGTSETSFRLYFLHRKPPGGTDRHESRRRTHDTGYTGTGREESVYRG